LKKLLLILMLAPVSTSAMAAWTRVSGFDAFTSYADISTISKEDNAAKMHVLYDFKTAEKTYSGKLYFSVVSQDDFDCKRKLTKVISYTYFSGNMAAGDVVYTFAAPFNNFWEPAESQSIMRPLWEVACAKK
jgi:Surface-adhesin protein E